MPSTMTPDDIGKIQDALELEKLELSRSVETGSREAQTEIAQLGQRLAAQGQFRSGGRYVQEGDIRFKKVIDEQATARRAKADCCQGALPHEAQPGLGICGAFLGRRKRADRNVISVRISERELHGLSIRIHVCLLFEPSDERACPLKRQVEIIDTEEQQEAVAGRPVIRAHQ